MRSEMPTKENKRVARSFNFDQHFPALAAALGFTPAETTALLNDPAAMQQALLDGVGSHHAALIQYPLLTKEGRL